MNQIAAIVATLVATVSGLAGCGASANGMGRAPETGRPTTPPAASLYDRLGRTPAIVAVVDDFTANLLADDAIKMRFANTDASAFKQKLVDQICEATGGPCKYTGKGMREAHAGMKISDAEFGALVADLKKALDQHNVPAREQGELISALGGMQPDVVNQ